MIIKCYRCGKNIDTPTPGNKFIPGNADYIIASDTIVKEPVDVLIAVKHNQTTLDKVAKIQEVDGVGNPRHPGLVIDEIEYDRVEVPDIKTAQQSFGVYLISVVAEVQDKDIQKTGIVCPDCYKPTDTLIWGTHKRTLLDNSIINH